MTIPHATNPLQDEKTYTRLLAPFDPAVVELKPGAVSEQKRQALALAYVDARHYQKRLDEVVGAHNWQVHYTPWGDRAVICSLTVCGVTRDDVGEAERGDPNQATSAAMQAFKRACASFGVGRYLYTDLPQQWVDAEQKGRSWVIVNPSAIVANMYQAAGISTQRHRMIRRIVALLDKKSDQDIANIGTSLAQG